MLNQVVIVGRLTDDPSTITTENGKKVSTIVLAVQRSYKNSEGLYETDFIRCILWNAVASSTCEYCKKGDIVGVKGRIQTSNYKDKENNTKYVTDVIAEKVTFLSSHPEKKEQAKE